MNILEKLKAISQAFNSSSSPEQLAMNLDLAGLSYNEAEKLYAENCKELIMHMSAFWCEDRKFSFKKALNHFDNYSCYSNISHFALPYGMIRLFDKDMGAVIKICAVALDGREIEQYTAMPTDSLSKDMFTLHSIDVLHETILMLMYEITKEIANGN